MKKGTHSVEQFENQLAALRQRITLSHPSATQNPNTTSSTGATSTYAPQDRSATSTIAFLQGGFSLAASQSRYVDPTEMAETLQYLKRTKRERLQEFAAMEEAFAYDQEEEERRVVESRLGEGRPVTYARPRNAPFVFGDTAATSMELRIEDHRATEGPSPQVPYPSTTGGKRSSSSSSSTGASSSRVFESLYDAKQVLSTDPQKHVPSLLQQNPQRFRLGDSTAHRSASASGSSYAASEGNSVPRSQARSTATTTTSKGAAALSTVGFVVPRGSVSVEEHIRRGLSLNKANSEVVPNWTEIKYRPDCVVQAVHKGRIRFCTHCGSCVVLPDTGAFVGCSQCNEDTKLLVASHGDAETNVKLSIASHDDAAAIREIEEMERREAREFQKALEEWRLGIASDGGENGHASSTTEVVGNATSPAAPLSLATLNVPAGQTYFSHLWSQLQQQRVE